MFSQTDDDLYNTPKKTAVPKIKINENDFADSASISEYALESVNAVYAQGIIKGDAKSVSIAAASVVAKVYRDRMMCEYDKLYPGYAFAKNKGYGTKEHMDALRSIGMSPIHRRSFVHL